MTNFIVKCYASERQKKQVFEADLSASFAF